MMQLFVMERAKLPPASRQAWFLQGVVYKVWHPPQSKFRRIVAILRERGRQDTHRGKQTLKKQG
jgi:hypothetical protein